MLNKGFRKYASNPVIGLLPFILFIACAALSIPFEYAAITSFISAVIGEIFFRLHYKSRSFSMTFYISGIASLITAIMWLLTHNILRNTFTYVVVFEGTIVILFMLLRASKTYIGIYFFREKNLVQKALMNEFYQSATLIQYGLTLHIFGILLYRQFVYNTPSITVSDLIVFCFLPAFIILSIGLYQALKTSSLASKLRREEWLPIVTEKGEVTGRIAKNISLGMKNRFLHPVVRVALIADSKVFMQERPADDILSPGKMDYPFEKYMLFNHEINLAARNSIKQMVGDEMSVSVNFLLKYVFENDDTRRLVFLFVANIGDENKIKRQGKMTGKFWTIKQLEEGFEDEAFGECFELEFEYLKNTVLAPSDVCGKPQVQIN